MISPQIRVTLINRFPQKLVDELLECYKEQKRNLLLGNLRPNEVEGGRFRQLEYDKDLIVKVGDKYKITRRGIQDVEARKLLDLE